MRIELSGRKGFFTAWITLLILSVLTGSASAQRVPAGVSAELPVAMTSPGLAPEGELVKILFDRLKVKVRYDLTLEAKDLVGNKTLILILGGSGKGLGAAGMNIQDELKRGEGLLAETKKLNIKLVGIHCGGEDRRGPVSSKFIDVLAPKVSYLVVREDGNKDGLFTRIAQQNKIPLTIIKQTQEITEILKELFKVK